MEFKITNLYAPVPPVSCSQWGHRFYRLEKVPRHSTELSPASNMCCWILKIIWQVNWTENTTITNQVNSKTASAKDVNNFWKIKGKNLFTNYNNWRATCFVIFGWIRTTKLLKSKHRENALAACIYKCSSSTNKLLHCIFKIKHSQISKGYIYDGMHKCLDISLK